MIASPNLSKIEPTETLQLDENSSVDIYRNWLDCPDFFFDHFSNEEPWEEIYLPGAKKPYHNIWYGVGWDSIKQFQKLTMTNPITHALAYIHHNMLDDFGIGFNSIQARLYKNGSDGTLWHSDLDHQVEMSREVACLSVGTARSLVFRPRDNMPMGDLSIPVGLDGYPSIRYNTGDVIITRGRTQDDWQHAVPKESASGARICLIFRQYKYEPEDM